MQKKGSQSMQQTLKWHGFTYHENQNTLQFIWTSNWPSVFSTLALVAEKRINKPNSALNLINVDRNNVCNNYTMRLRQEKLNFRPCTSVSILNLFFLAISTNPWPYHTQSYWAENNAK